MGHGAWGIGHGRNRIKTRITFLSSFNFHCPLPIAQFPTFNYARASKGAAASKVLV